MSRFGFGLMAGLMAFAIGCSESDDDDTTPGEVMVEVAITAAEGGTVELASATLAIPANSLAADTVITATAKAPASGLPNQSTLRGQQFVFGPSGTAFDPAAILTLPLPSGTTGKGTPVISWLDEASGKWVDLVSAATGNTIAAPVEHFTTFIVRFLGEEPISCDAAACGGNPAGSWRLVGGCVSKNPFEDGCPEATVAGVLDGSSGVLTIGGNNTFSFTASINGNFEATFPASCYAGKGPQSCADVGEGVRGSCTGDVATACDCTIPLNDSIDESGTWSVEGNVLIIDAVGDEESSIVPFCAADDTLWLDTGDKWLKFVPQVQ